MNGGQAFLQALTISLVALHEALCVAQGVIAQRATGLDIENAIRLCLLGNGYSLVYQSHGLLRILIHQDVDQIHVDRWFAFQIALLLHTTNHVPETLFRTFLVATIVIDMSHHIDGHIHFLVEFLLRQFSRQLGGQLISFKDALTVQFEHNFITTLGIVCMDIPLSGKIIFQSADSFEEACTVACIKGMMHRVTKGQIFLRLLIIGRIVGMC